MEWPYLIPNLQKAIPGAGCYGEAVVCDSQAADSVVVSREDTHPLPLEGVPYVTVEVVVSGQQ